MSAVYALIVIQTQARMTKKEMDLSQKKNKDLVGPRAQLVQEWEA